MTAPNQNNPIEESTENIWALIKKLCPEGVEYRKLKSVCKDIIVPMRDRPKIFDGTIPWCRIEDKEGHYFNRSLSGLGVSEDVVRQMNLKIFPTGTVICSCSASIGAYAINTQPLITNQTFIGLVCGKELFNKYLLYYMETQTQELLSQATTGTIPYISRAKFENLSIPIPPLPVQREIVRILDAFTELTEKLSEELTARKKQYAFYRDKMLSFNEGKVEWVRLGDVALIQSGGTPSKGNPDFWENGTIKWLGSSVCKNQKFVDEVTGYITELGLSNSSAKILRKKTTLIAMVGATIGKVAYLTFEAATNQNVASLYPCDENKLSPSYLYYICSTLYDKFEEIGKKGFAIANLSFIRNLLIPLPPLSEQRYIAAILDRFDALCNDLSAGLPAEIDARRKQYEYYRDLLLGFEATNPTP